MIDLLKAPEFGQVEYENRDVVILCEGKDEAAVIRRMLPKESGWKCGRAQNKQGEEAEIKAIKDAAELHFWSLVLCLVFDAEEDREVRQQQIAGWLVNAGFVTIPVEGEFAETPNDPEDPTRGRVCVGYLIDPPKAKSGKLEDMFLPQIADSSYSECAEAFATCAKAKGSKQHEEKLLLRSFIACHNAYNTTIHIGLQDRLFDLKDKAFDVLRDFLKEAERIQANLT